LIEKSDPLLASHTTRTSPESSTPTDGIGPPIGTSALGVDLILSGRPDCWECSTVSA
jgi:hypothetical protein